MHSNEKNPFLAEEKYEYKKTNNPQDYNPEYFIEIQSPISNEWLEFLKDGDIDVLINQISKNGLSEINLNSDSREWSLFHYLIAFGYYEVILRLIDFFPLNLLNTEANGHTPLDIALLTGQWRIAACLDLVGFQISPSLYDHPYLKNLRENQSLARIALSFWAIANRWNNLFEKLIKSASPFEPEIKEGLAKLAYQLDNLEVLKYFNNFNMLTKELPYSLNEVNQIWKNPADYLNALLANTQDFNLALRFLLSEWPTCAKDRQEWISAQLKSSKDNRLLFILTSRRKSAPLISIC
ncbi:hypothetical protein CbuD7E6568_05680 [Coxiella burnetii]|uniref:ankyrin repeat domain-containing protein n=1 Tax=Coxiella burnetii TaxID=777 RepID=UPI000B953C86|nr:ankyrin repeat domain-containing protein [Coxiella burnetii]OYK80254.1 hypothetical protein CbuD7E6568_05680 [Coxiella burnetii]